MRYIMKIIPHGNTSAKKHNLKLNKQSILKQHIIIGGYQGPTSLHTKSVKYFISEISNNFVIDFIMDVTINGDKASSLIEKTQQGEIHVSYLLSSYFEKILPEIKILDLPYLFNNRNEAYNALKSDFFDYIDCLLYTSPSPRDPT